MDNAQAAGQDKREQIVSGRVLLGVSLVPWLNLAVWTAFALTTHFALGHFPHCYYEDAPQAVWTFFVPLVFASFLLIVVSIPLWYVRFYGHVRRWKDRTPWRADVVYGLGWGTTFLLAIADPVHFLRWFMD